MSKRKQAAPKVKTPPNKVVTGLVWLIGFLCLISFLFPNNNKPHLPLPTATELGDRQQLRAATHTNEPTDLSTNTPTLESSATVAPKITVKSATLNVRAGPGTNYPLLGKLNKGDVVTPLGYSEDQGWYMLDCQGKRCWISASTDLVSITGDTTDLVIFEAPTLAPVLSTRAPRPTANAVSQPTAKAFTCPRNCAEAVRLGLTAQQAGQCPNLDRDHDHVACYGD